MKNLKTKILIPVMAIIFAITASAFTVESNSTADSSAAMITGYIENSIPGQPCQSVNVDCTFTGDFLCTVGGEQAYRILNGTVCAIQLKKQNKF